MERQRMFYVEMQRFSTAQQGNSKAEKHGVLISNGYEGQRRVMAESVGDE